mgnify:CR=1 FL=1
MEIKISGCKDCIFCSENDAGSGSTCRLAMDILYKLDRQYTNKEYADTQINVDKKYNPITPEWCPLKNENVTVSY